MDYTAFKILRFAQLLKNGMFKVSRTEKKTENFSTYFAMLIDDMIIIFIHFIKATHFD